MLCSGWEDPNPVWWRTGASHGCPLAAEKSCCPLPDSGLFQCPNVCLPQCRQGQTSHRKEGDSEYRNTNPFWALRQVGKGATFSGQPASLSVGHLCIHLPHTPSSPGARGRHTWFQREPPLPTPAGPAPPHQKRGGHPAPRPCQPGQSPGSSWVPAPRQHPENHVFPSCLPSFFLHHVFESTLKMLHRHIS